MRSHEAERCLVSLVKGGERGSEREQKQEETGALESVMLLALGQFFDWQSGGKMNKKRTKRGKKLMQQVKGKE